MRQRPHSRDEETKANEFTLPDSMFLTPITAASQRDEGVLCTVQGREMLTQGRAPRHSNHGEDVIVG